MATAPLPPDLVFARDYKILRPLDEGGMGAVYVVEQLSTGEQRALKVLQPHLVADGRARERFLQEARVRARIKSEHVVKVLAAGVDEATGLPWLVMELLDGETLDALVERRQRLPPAEVCTIFEHVGHALSAAHAAGVVHRDIKPENIFVATSQRADVPFTVKLLDFGIAKVVQEPIAGATTGALLGSPLWMAPEQCNAGRIRAATDVWALGLLAFWALTGKYYWKAAHGAGTTIESLLVDILFSVLEPASRRAAHYGFEGALPEGFDDWFSRCLRRAPEERFTDAGEAASALLPILSGGAVRVTFPSLVTPPPARDLSPTGPSAPVPRPPGSSPGAPLERASPRDDLEYLPTIPQRPGARPSGARTLYLVVPAVFVVALAVTVVLGLRNRPSEGAPSAPTALPSPSDAGPRARPPMVPVAAVDAGPEPSPVVPRATSLPMRGTETTPTPTRPVALARAPVPPRAAGHTFRRRADWDVNCPTGRQRRAWTVSPYFTSHDESEDAARRAGCVDLVGGIGWCCP